MNNPPDIVSAYDLISATDIPKTDPIFAHDLEQSYRRGYCHGAWAADDARDRYPASKVNRWLDKLLKWRYKGHSGELEQPPSP